MSGRTLFVILIRVVGLYLLVWGVVGLAQGGAMALSGSQTPAWAWVPVIVPMAVGAWMAVAAGRIADWFRWLDEDPVPGGVGGDDLAGQAGRLAARVVGLVAVVGALPYLGRCIAAWVASAELREGFPISIVANAIQAGTYAFAALVLLLFSRRRRATVA